MTLESLFQPILSEILRILEVWWWVLLPIILYYILDSAYHYWLWWEVFYKDEIDWAIFEVIPPAELEKPFKAMEDVFSRLWPMYDGPNWREINCQGEFKMAFWYSWEIVSIEGRIHFYIRAMRKMRKMIESAIQAHFPETEIFEVEDYTKDVPQDIPNDKYRMYGEDYIAWLDELAPIRTYKYFEPTSPEAVISEKKVDPIYSLLEGLAKLGQGEQIWFQIVCVPIIDEIPWIKMAKEKINKLAKRPEPSKDKSIVAEAARTLFLGKTPFEEEKKEVPVIPPEMKLTPGERQTLADMEEKIKKIGYKVYMRLIYLAEADKYFSPHGKLIRGYMAHFNTPHKILMFDPKTRTRIHYFFRRRRLYKRKRDIFRKYVLRLPSYFPDLVKGTTVLNVEELATLFHFPTKASLLPPGVPRILARKKESPPGIPFE